MTTTVRLPPPTPRGTKSLEEVILRRRSAREFMPEQLSQFQLSQILWSAQGITDSAWGLRSVPSAGATFPLELFVACGTRSVEGMNEGIYHYEVNNHSLTRHHEKDIRTELAEASVNQDIVSIALVDIIICALYSRTTSRYGGRGERYILLEVGHAGQNIYLEATALGLASVAIGAFDDDQVRELLRLDSRYSPLYIMAVGKPK